MQCNKLLVFIVLGIFVTTAHAEYYVSDGCNGPACVAPCPIKKVYKRHHSVKKCYVKKHYVVKKYYNRPCAYTGTRYKRNSYKVSVYYYYPQPVCGCERTYVPAKCGCGRYVPGHWVSTPRTYVKFVGPYKGYSFSETWYSPVNDRATADDYGADMEIN